MKTHPSAPHRIIYFLALGSVTSLSATSLYASTQSAAVNTHCQTITQAPIPPNSFQATLEDLTAEQSEQNPPSQTRNYKDEREAWRDSGVTMNHLRQFVNTHNCNSDNHSFSGCLWATNQVLRHADDQKERVWVPREYFDRHTDEFQAIELNGGQLVLTQWKPIAEKDFTQSKKKALERKRALNQAYIDLRSKNLDQGLGLNFDKMLAHAAHLALGKDQQDEALVAVDGWNAYLSVSSDPHSSVMLSWSVPIQTHSSVGIGVTTQFSGGDLFLFPEPGSPTEKAGVHKGDLLLAIDGTSTQGRDFNSIASKFKGDEGTSLRLTVLRDGKELSFDIKRQALIHPVVTDEVIPVGKKNIGYMKLSEFNNRSCPEMKAGLIRVLEAKPEGLVLDLRGNLGGWVEAARCVASLFLPPQTEVVSTGDAEPTLTSDAPITDLPIVVLTNSMSASAAEILSGALQDHQRAIVMGERSFGKGSFQLNSTDRANPMISYAMTMGTYSLPRGRSPQLTGILPDIEVFRDPSILREDDSPALREEDLYINPLKADPIITPSLNFRKARQVRECLASQGTARAEYSARLSARKFADYQVIAAADALGRCWNEPSSVSQKAHVLSSCEALTKTLADTTSTSQTDSKTLEELSARFQNNEKADASYDGSSVSVRDYQKLLELDDQVTEEKAFITALQNELKNRRCSK